ncbi:glycosyltransferase [Psychroflexus salis]|uniref:Glycosyltransferase 2-like domain-containing protein n=1 Tax=Psychroflexus salis TaxID=1526574 RepID=A0A916ZRL6_9FLAO|nr:glycosyltransferase [Psychroflexus salis]GGE10771.1 hypothetical protein GCM10010831_10320 [Psychroflexus salis]
MKSTLVTFFYPNVKSFIFGLVASINEQSLLPNELIVFNDNMEGVEEELEELKINFKIIQVKGTPFENRLEAFEFLKTLNTDYIIFQDADDLMGPKRIEVVVGKLKKHDLVVNDLSLMTYNGDLYRENIWSDRLKNNFKINDQFINDKNIIGLGNTSIKKNVLIDLNIVTANREIYAADWFIFYQLLKDHTINAIFTSETSTYYRQHQNNISTLHKTSNEALERLIKVRKAHYEGLESAGYDMKLESLNLKNIKLNSITNTLESRHDSFWWET